MGEQCSWKGDTMAVVLMVMTMMMVVKKFIEENQNIEFVARFLELWSAGIRNV